MVGRVLALGALTWQYFATSIYQITPINQYEHIYIYICDYFINVVNHRNNEQEKAAENPCLFRLFPSLLVHVSLCDFQSHDGL